MIKLHPKLTELIKELQIDLIIPSTEQEQSQISKFLENGKLRNVKVLGCFKEIYEIGKDKFNTIRWLNSMGAKVLKLLFKDLSKEVYI